MPSIHLLSRAGVVRLVRHGAAGDNDATAILPHHVLRLDVAVKEACRVNGCEGAAQIAANQGGLSSAERTLRGKNLLERGT